MAKDKYQALWVSYSSISEFLVCPRAYYLSHVHRNRTTGKKIRIITPPLALGQAVHQVIESISTKPVDERFEDSLVMKLDEVWKKVEGKKGGFLNKDIEHRYKERGREMLRKLQNHPGPLANKAVKISSDLPYFWLSERDEIILCGKLDWLEYLPKSDGVHIIDFKTGKSVEGADSLQLPIYFSLAQNCQKRDVKRASYWYLARDTQPKLQDLPSLEEAESSVLETAKKIKLERKLNKLTCPHNGCSACTPLEKVLAGEGEKVGEDDFGNEVFILQEERDEGSYIH